MICPEFCKIFLQKWGLPQDLKKKIQKSGLFILQKSGQNYFFVEFKSPHFCKMKIQKSGRESRLISVYALYEHKSNIYFISSVRVRVYLISSRDSLIQPCDRSRDVNSVSIGGTFYRFGRSTLFNVTVRLNLCGFHPYLRSFVTDHLISQLGESLVLV